MQMKMHRWLYVKYESMELKSREFITCQLKGVLPASTKYRAVLTSLFEHFVAIQSSALTD